MLLIIPMAGEGQRFKQAGYIWPKPFIKIDHRTMIEIVTENIMSQISDPCDIMFICRKSHLTDERKLILESFKTKTRNVSIVELDHLTDGAACTILYGLSKVSDLEQEIIVANSDQLILDPLAISDGLRYFQSRRADGGIFTFYNDHPKWSYVKIHNEYVTEVVEKQVVSDRATCGIYYYKTGLCLLNAINRMMNDDFRVNGEFYLAPAYNFIDGHILYFNCDQLVGLGTPEDLKIFLDSYDYRTVH